MVGRIIILNQNILYKFSTNRRLVLAVHLLFLLISKFNIREDAKLINLFQCNTIEYRFDTMSYNEKDLYHTYTLY